jgi:hypothetical protein
MQRLTFQKPVAFGREIVMALCDIYTLSAEGYAIGDTGGDADCRRIRADFAIIL